MQIMDYILDSSSTNGKVMNSDAELSRHHHAGESRSPFFYAIKL